MSKLVGIFECTKCNLVFTASPMPGFPPSCLPSWYLECPNRCVNEIKYDDYPPPYYEMHKLFKWLNYEKLFGKETKNGKSKKDKSKNKKRHMGKR